MNADDKRTQADSPVHIFDFVIEVIEIQKYTQELAEEGVLTAAQRVKVKGIYIGQRHLHRTVLHVLHVAPADSLCEKIWSNEKDPNAFVIHAAQWNLRRLILTPSSLNVSNLPH